MIDWEIEMASALDVLNSELRVNGPIEVEQYKMGQMREGIQKLVDYLRAKIDRREASLAASESARKALEAELAEEGRKRVDMMNRWCDSVAKIPCDCIHPNGSKSVCRGTCDHGESWRHYLTALATPDAARGNP